MLKYVLLAGAMAISAPAFAQDQAAPAEPAATTGAPAAPTAAEPAQDSTATPAAPTATAQATPEQKPMTTESVPASDAQVAQAAPAADPAAAPANKAEQVASVVNTEFPTYDKDSDGSLNNAEFSSWMVALKTASDPATKAESAEVKTWVQGAFASADTDKNKSVSKTELTGFLSQGG